MSVNSFNEFSAAWATMFWRASWQGGIAIMLVLIATRSIRQIPAFAQCWLWRLAYLKLFIAGITAFSFELCWLPPRSTPVQETRIVSASEPPRHIHESRVVELSEVPTSDTAISRNPSDHIVSALNDDVALSRASWLMIGWIVGQFACLTNFLWHWIIVRKMISSLGSASSERLDEILVENCNRIGVKVRPKLLVSNDTCSPFLFGVFRPVIVLPSSVLTSCSRSAISTAILHELAHVERRDLAWNWLPALADVMFFFHPLVWLAKRESRLVQEIATDQFTIATSQMGAARYAGLLVELVGRCSAATNSPHVVVGVSESYSQLSRRIIAMQAIQPLTKRGVIATNAVIVAFIVCGMIPWRLAARNALAQTDPVAPRPKFYSRRLSSNEIAEQEVAIKEIEKLGGSIHFESQNEQRSAIQVDFSQKSTVIDTDLAHLKQLPNLLALTLHYHNLSDAGLEQLRDLKNLKVLAIDKSKVTNAGLANLKGLTGLSNLELGNIRINDEGVVHLKGLTNLEMLLLRNTGITDEGLIQLKGMTKLYHLGLDGTRITDAGLEYLSGLTNLQDLRLNNTGVTDDGLVHLKGLTNLKTLVLNQTEVWGFGLVHLKSLPRLEALFLSDTNITDAGLEYLNELTGLRTLNLDRNSGITDEGIQKLQAVLPDCQIDSGSSVKRTVIPHGTIRRVEHSKRVAWISLGEADSVKPKFIFDVFEKEIQDVRRSRKEIKAKIEVTRLLGPHMSEARIVSEDLERPIVADDLVVHSTSTPVSDLSGIGETDLIVSAEQQKTIGHLVMDFRTAKDARRQEEIAWILISKGDKNVIPHIEKMLNSTDKKLRCTAALVLAGFDDKRGVTALITELNDKQPLQNEIVSDRRYPVILLGKLGTREGVPVLIESLRDHAINNYAAISLGQIGDKRAIPALREMNREFPERRFSVGCGLAALGEQEGFDILNKIAGSDLDWSERKAVADALAKIGDSRGVSIALLLLLDKHVNVRASAARTLGQIGNRSVLPALNEALNDKAATDIYPPTTVEIEAQKAIRAIKRTRVNIIDIPDASDE